MKQIYTIILSALLFLGNNSNAEGIKVISSQSHSLNLKVEIPQEIQFRDITFKDGGTFTIFNIKGAGQFDKPGKPNLPAFGKWILVPNGTNVNITVNKGNPIVFNNVNLAPVQYPKPDITDEKERPFVKDEVVYSKDKDFPGIFSEVEPVSKKRGQSITILWVYPYQYNPVTKTLTVYPDLNVNVSFAGAIRPIPSNLKTDNLIRSLKGMALNANEVLEAENAVESKTMESKSSKDDGCEMLIITYSSFSEAANDLAAWKRRRGIITKVVTTSTTGTSSSQIETYINNAYNNWSPAPSYVLFLGDANYVATVYRNLHPEHGYPYYQGHTASDIWYADVDEVSGTIPVADMAYGRIPVSSLTRADSVVNRIIRYERTPPAGSSFYTHTTNAGAFQDGATGDPPDTYANRRFAKTSEDVRNYLDNLGYVTERIYTTINGYNSATIYPTYWNDGSYVFENDGGGGLELPSSLQKPTFPWDGSTSDISSAINDGRFFLMHRDHGNRSGWAHPGFYESNVDALSNGELRPIVFSINCETGWFDNETDDSECSTGYTDECFVESWINHSTGGSCGLIAPTRISYSGNNDRLIWGWMDAIWPGFLHGYDGTSPINSPEYRMGDVLTYGLSYMMSHYTWGGDTRRTSIEEYNYFGDPTMEIWNSTPSSLTNAYTTTNVDIGTTSVTVQVEPHIAGMLVTICTETADDVFGTAYTNSSGIATVYLNNAVSSQPMVYVTITKHNYRPYEFVAGRNIWTGAISNNWHTAGNWSMGILPTSEVKVTIAAGTPNDPVINSGTAYCKSLSLQMGSSLSQNTGTYFHCYGTFDAGFGQFTMSGTSYLYFNGSSNTVWWDDYQDDTYTYVRVEKSVGTASMTMNNNMTCSGTFEIREGILNINEGKTLTITSSSYAALQVESGGTLTLNGNQTIDATGGIDFMNNSQLNMTAGYIKTGGNFLVESNTAFDIHFNGGWLYMTGSGTQYIQDQDDGNLQLYGVAIEKPSGVCYIANADLDINGSLFINSGTLSCRSDAGSATAYNINDGKDWTNNVGSTGFEEATGRVIFDGGNYHQYCSNETFNELEINKPSGGAFRMNGTHVVCAAYDWTAGAVDVLSGSFTANDLIDNGIYGAFYLNTGGTINLTNNNGYVDLDGELHIFGGTMNVYGGTTDSYWPYAADASITMSDGVLDFHDQGIYIYNSATHALTENISGGVIRTSQGYSGNRGDFTPAAGTFEFYGTSDYYISQQNGSTLYDVNIDKSTKTGNSSSVAGKPVVDERSGMIMGPGSKSNTISLNTDFVVTNNMTVTSGGLKLNGHELSITHNCDVYGTLTMDNAADVLNVGSVQPDFLQFFSGATGNFAQGNVYVDWGLLVDDGASFTGLTTNTLHFNSSLLASTVRISDNSAVFGNVEINKPSGYFYIAGGSSAPFEINGNLTVGNNEVECQKLTMILHGNFSDQTGSEIYLGFKTSDASALSETGKPGNTGNKSKSGYFELDNDFTLNGLLDIESGTSIIAHGLITEASSGTVTITGGSYSCDASSGFNTFNGTYNMSAGLMEFTASHVRFYGIPNLTGGTVRAGRTVGASDSGFQQNGGTFEFIGSTTGNYIQFDANNYINDFLFNRTGNYIIYPQNSAPVFVIKGDVTINSGTFSSNGNNIEVGGNWTNNAGASAFNETTGTVTFNGSNSADILTDETFYNLGLDKTYGGYDGLEFANGITVNVSNDFNAMDGDLEMNNNSTLNITGDVHLFVGGGLNAYSDPGLEITVGGNFTDDNTSNTTLQGYTPGDEVITFNGSGNQYITTAAPYEEFGNLVIDKSAGEFKPNDSIYVHGDFTLTNGTWSDNVNGLSHYFEEDILVNGGLFSQSPNKNTVNLVSDKDAALFFTATPANGFLNILNIDKSTITKSAPGGDETSNKLMEKAVSDPEIKGGSKSQTVTLSSKVFCGLFGGVSIQNGTLDLNGFEFTSTGDLNVNSNGILYAGSGSSLRIGQNQILNINDGGQVSLIGTSGSNVLVTHYNPGNYKFNVNDGGTLASEFTTFEYIDFWGLYFKTGSTLDPAHALDYCRFQNVESTGGASDITFDNDQVVTCTGIDFPDNPYYNVYKSVNSGDVTFADATGDYAGPEYEYDPYGRVHWSGIDIDLSLTVMLEGAYNGTNMNTDLNTLGLIPLSQPFNSISTADWYYTGTESVGSIPANVVDWVLVQIRDASDAGSADAGTVVAEQAAFVLNDGSIVDLDGSSSLYFPNLTYTSGLYPVVWHRNHLGVISANRMIRSGGVYSYDFTASGSAYSNSNAGEKDLGGGVYGLFGGDGNGSGWITYNGDDLGWWKNQAGESNDYFETDYNLDGDVDNKDKNDVLNYNQDFFSQIPGSKSSGKTIDE